jgi:hypothetical protein
MEINAEFFNFDVPFDKISKTLRDAINVQMRQAARAFEKAALALIPIDTGFAASPFRNIGEAVTSKETKVGPDIFRRKALRRVGKQLRALAKEERQIRKQQAMLQNASDRQDHVNRVLRLQEQLEEERANIQELRRKLREKAFKIRGENFGSNLFKPGRKIRRRGPQTPGGAFFKIAALLRQGRQNLGFEHADELNEEQPIPFYYYNGKKVRKTPVEGHKFGTPPQQIFTQQGNRYYFNFANKIIYYRIEDFYGKHSGPWRSMQAGRDAFLNYWNTQGFKKLPFFGNLRVKGTSQDDKGEFGENLSELFITTVVKVSGTSISRTTIRGKPGSKPPSQKAKSENLSTRPKGQGKKFTPEQQKRLEKVTKVLDELNSRRLKNKAKRLKFEESIKKQIEKNQKAAAKLQARIEKRDKNQVRKQRRQVDRDISQSEHQGRQERRQRED